MLRTVAGAYHHIEAMVQLMLHFHWNWVVVLVSSDDYGRENSQLLWDRLAQGHICIAFQEVLPMNQAKTRQDRRRLEAIVDKLLQSTARVVLVFSPDLVLHDFFRVVLRRNLTDIVWIAPESWAIDPVLHDFSELRQVGTFLGITTRSVPIPGFKEFRLRRTQATAHTSVTSKGSTCNQECDKCLNTTVTFNSILTLSRERTVYNVYSAVYAVAHGLHRLLGCTETHCSKDVVYPWRVSPSC